ncbi:MAG: protein translocase subunit SecF [Clostridia bacterium]|nr:protein translocase subunit SecF [Clostridia bacterium]
MNDNMELYDLSQMITVPDPQKSGKTPPKKPTKQSLGKISFTKWRKWFFLYTGICLVIGLVIILLRGFAWDTDFIGGTSMQINIGHTLNADDLADITEITEGIIEKKVSSVQKTGDNGDQVIIKCTEIDTEVRDAVFEALKAEYNLTDEDRLNVTSVGASVSADFRKSGITSVALAVALMLVYITIRFDFKSGVAAVFCLAHDLFFMLVAYALFQLPMNSNVIAALLTILGYSINATIIVFDRVRENVKLYPNYTFDENMTLSSNQTLLRSVNTTVTTLLTIVMIYIFGVQSIQQFILPLIVGIVAGLYSSVCLSGNIWAILQKVGGKKKLPAEAEKAEKAEK